MDRQAPIEIHSPARTSAIPRLSRLPLPKPTSPPNPTSRPTGRLAVKPSAPELPTDRPRAPLLKTSPQPKAGYLRSTAASSVRTREEQGNISRRAGDVNASHGTYSTSPLNKGPTIANKTEKVGGTARKSRPSLSDRTVESLAKIPPSPVYRQKSNFFDDPNSPRVRRPGSSLSVVSRPGTSDGILRPKLAAYSPQTTPTKFNTAVLRGGIRPSARTELNFATREVKSANSTPIKFNTAVMNRGIRPSTKTELDFSTRSPQSTIRTTASTVSRRPPLPSGSKTLGATPRRSRTAASEIFTPNAAREAIPPVPALPTVKTPVGSPLRSTKSSLALREQIRKAKAARKSDVEPKPVNPTASGLPPEAHADPFNQLPKLGASLMRRRIDQARIDGRLNLAATGLQSFPDEVLKMYDFAANADSNVPWGEVVDLTRMNLADNDLKELPEALFPDVDVSGVLNQEEVELPQFGGLEVLDLHGNLLTALPMGMRRLERLTSLNLTRNSLDNDVLSVISQIKSLRDLKLAETSLSGALPESIGQLRSLETLDLSMNKLTSLPDSMQQLTHLRTLDVSQNQLATLPLAALQHCPLRDLIAPKNALAGTLFPDSVSGHPRLERLLVACNGLTALTPHAALALPRLAVLDVSVNRLTTLPELDPCPSHLATLLAEDNRIIALPPGFAGWPRLRVADFTGNELRVLDERVGLMEALDTLRVAANPLRDRKFLSMGTEGIKKDLRGRLSPSLD